MPKKNDNRVGRSDGPAVNGGHQTAQQAEIVKQEGGGLTDKERPSSDSDGSRSGNPGIGGSSGGHSDQMGSRGKDEDRKVAGGLSDSERTHGDGSGSDSQDG